MFFDNVWADRVAKAFVVLALALCILFITRLVMYALAPIDTVQAERTPGEYVLDDGPIGVFYAGEFDGMELYNMQDIETGGRCYIVADRECTSYRCGNPVAISCIFDPLTPRG